MGGREGVLGVGAAGLVGVEVGRLDVEIGDLIEEGLAGRFLAPAGGAALGALRWLPLYTALTKSIYSLPPSIAEGCTLFDRAQSISPPRLLAEYPREKMQKYYELTGI